MFRALGHRNFRLFFAGAFLSNAGTWMQSVAQSWLVLQLTDSGTWLGVDTFMVSAAGEDKGHDHRSDVEPPPGP